MIKLFSTLLMLLIFTVTFAQQRVENPKTGFSTVPYLDITSIEIQDTATVLSFHISFQPNNWIFIPKESFIQPVGSETKRYAKGTADIPLNKKYWIPESGEASYKIIFPPIDPQTKAIDYGEGNDGGTWFIYDIRLEKAESLLPGFMGGHWFNSQTGMYELSLLDTIAVYKNSIWNISNSSLSGNKGSLTLKKKGNELELLFKKDKKGKIYIGETSQRLIQISHKTDKNKLAENTTEIYQEPLIRMDTATYSGYIAGYTPRIGVKTMSIAVDDILCREQRNYLAEIDSSGHFVVKIPIYYPHLAFIRSKIYSGTIFLEPGKSVFQVIDNSSPRTKLYMGESAGINSELLDFQEIVHFNFNHVEKEILNQSPSEYKTFCINAWEKEKRNLNRLFKNKEISARAYQVHQADIDYFYASIIMSYPMKYQMAYKKKYDLSWNDLHAKLNMDSLTIDCADFITNDFVNSETALLGMGYSQLINRLKFMKELRGKTQFTIQLSDLAQYLGQRGIELTDAEKQTIDITDRIDSINNLPDIKEFNEKFAQRNYRFIQKHKKVFDDLQAINGPEKTSIIMLADVLLQLGDSITDDEKELIEANRKIESDPNLQHAQRLSAENSESIMGLHKKYRPYFQQYINNKKRLEKEDKLMELFGIEPGLATNIMRSQDLCRKIVSERTPMNKSELSIATQGFTNPFIPQYITACNNETLQKNDPSNRRSDSHLKATPKAAADKVFDEIISKHKGKVVYVDFWATWCAPCRSGIKRIKPLKEEISADEVVFVYITNQTSPEVTWKSMINDIKGEHYRLDNDEWNYLKTKFNISGIPHYVLVGKDGAIINPHLDHMNNPAIKSLLEKYIAK